jgi:hypothetical protein
MIIPMFGVEMDNLGEVLGDTSDDGGTVGHLISSVVFKLADQP